MPARSARARLATAGIDQTQHHALSHVEDRLPRRECLGAAEGCGAPAPPTNFTVLPSCRICSAPSPTLPADRRAMKVPTNSTALAFWLMLMKPPAPPAFRARTC